MLFQMRAGFGFNTDLFETNVLNLAVVVGIVVVVVGNALSELLDQRRQIILSTLSEADKKVQEAQRQLEEARKSVETARLNAVDLRRKAVQTVEQENVVIQKQLKDRLQYLQDTGKQTIELERQRIVQNIAQQVANLALNRTEVLLLSAFEQTNSKQKELNEKHIRDTFRQLKR